MAKRAKRRKHKPGQGDPSVGLTTMIDVVFLLLFFFLVTFNPGDPKYGFDFADRPIASGAGGNARVPVIHVEVLSDGYRVQGVGRSIGEVQGHLSTLAGVSTNQSVDITCDQTSRHAGLIAVLDVCSGIGLADINVSTGVKRP